MDLGDSGRADRERLNREKVKIRASTVAVDLHLTPDQRNVEVAFTITRQGKRPRKVTAVFSPKDALQHAEDIQTLARAARQTERQQ